MSAAALALAACAPTVPNSGAPDAGAGVGFGSYDDYQKQQATRDAQLSGASPVSTQTIGGETQAVLSATRPASVSPTSPQPALVNSVGISNENDFDAVGSQRTIEADAARREALKAQYQQAEVTAVPTRAGDGGGASLVEYALNTTNPVGQSQYQRRGVNLAARHKKNCGKYPSPDMAQAEFLQKGGPLRDRLALDPDGDGFACDWDPAPFRSAKNAVAKDGVVEVVEKLPEE
ncbi:hypothetical protein KO498_03110 [Lentibacter algarum]|nr:hypothetical protein [Lentibacter algarum]MBU2980794.1 hypothetical protein [Lentibacter algarum]